MPGGALWSLRARGSEPCAFISAWASSSLAKTNSVATGGVGVHGLPSDLPGFLFYDDLIAAVIFCL